MYVEFCQRTNFPWVFSGLRLIFFEGSQQTEMKGQPEGVIMAMVVCRVNSCGMTHRQRTRPAIDLLAASMKPAKISVTGRLRQYSCHLVSNIRISLSRDMSMWRHLVGVGSCLALHCCLLGSVGLITCKRDQQFVS